MEPDIDATTSTRAIDNSTTNQIDAMVKVFGQLRFRQCYKKTIATSAPPWLQQSINSSSGRTTSSNSRSTGTSASAIHRKHLIVDLQHADERMHSIIVRSGGQLVNEWTEYNASRSKIRSIFCDLIKYEMKFCRQHSVEQYFWKILYYNVIETMRRVMGDTANNASDVVAPSNVDDYRSVCATVIDDGLEFFDSLIQTLTDTYHFRLDEFLGAHSGRNLKGLKYVALALVSAQKFCMYKGDLLRYREQINDSAHFGAATQWYVKAYQLIPSNGMPSNQLAILSLYGKRKFDAIFYHMRSLHASNPIKSAKESLVILFDELRKKYQLLEAQHNNGRHDTGSSSGTSARAGNSKSNESFKREIWVHPTDGQLNYRTVILSQNDGESLDSVDLYKKFIFHFSCVHGILFTKVGAESLDTCMVQTLKQFQELLNHRTSGVFTLQKMVQMFVLNVLAIENCAARNESVSLTNAAVAFAFAYIGIVLSKLKIELDESIGTGIDGSTTMETADGRHTIVIKNINRFRLSDSINNSMACVSLWCNWLKGNGSIWKSADHLHAIHEFCKTFGLCVWDELAKLITTLAQFDFDAMADFVIVCSGDCMPPQQNYVKFRLPEEMLTLGVPHLLLIDNLYCKDGTTTATTTTTTTAVRDRDGDGDGRNGDNHINNVSSFQRMKYIYGFCSTDLLAAAVIQVDTMDGSRSERALLKKLKSGKFISTNICNSDKGEALCRSTSTYHNETGVHSMLEQKHSSGTAASAAIQVANTIESGTAPQRFDERNTIDNDAAAAAAIATAVIVEQRDDSSSAEIQKLLQRKNELEQSHKMHEKLNQFTQEILQKDNADVSVCIEIRPKYLVPDTNCYIDFLREIKQLIDTYPLYHVIVPIVVLNELEGLAKGDMSSSGSGGGGSGGGTKVYDTPTKTSRLAQKALLFLKNVGTTVKCATTKGSFLNSMAFTRESDFLSSPSSSSTSATLEHLNNDDKILLTVTNLSKIHSVQLAAAVATMQKPSSASMSPSQSPSQSQSSVSNLQRKVVLLTNDRNLKLKAITQNIPVRELVDFIKWSSINK